MKATNLLPIGTVVTVKDASRKMMIVGILQTSGGKEYDYMAVLYPEGFLDQDHFYLFNHADIAEVTFLGFMDAEYQVFRSNLQKVLEDKGS